MSAEHEGYPVRRYRSGAWEPGARDEIAAEEPLEIRVAGRAISVTMRTPGHDDELAAGFLLGEGVLRTRADIEHLRPCPHAAGSVLDVLIAPGVATDLAAFARQVYTSSSCGVCGLASIDAVRKKFPPVAEGHSLTPEVLLSLPEALRAAQSTFDRTGGLHAAGLFDASGRALVVREDVGRHNAVDKVLGHALLAGWTPLRAHTLCVSGRLSFEIVQKALAAGVPILCAVSAPSSLAVDLAEESNITLAGFVRPGRFNLYTHTRRIAGAG